MPTTPASTRPRGRHHRRRHRRLASILAVVLGLTALTACEPDITPPTWNVATVRSTPATLGPHLALDWQDASGGATRYEVHVARISSGVQGPWQTFPMDVPATSGCLVVGLDAMVPHRIRVTAYDAAGNWSGDITGPNTYGSVTVTHTPPASSTGGGTTRRCLPLIDGDVDRIPDVLEKGSAVPTGPLNLGSAAGQPDTDDDGLQDGDEAYGTADGLDLPGFGVRLLGKDILVETDWASEVTMCSTDLRPTADWVGALRAAFATMPIPSYPGSTQRGIKLIVDYGQGGVFTGGNAIPDANGRLVNDPPGTHPRPTHFTAEREGYFHYAVVSTQRLNAGVWDESSSGDLGGDEIRVSHGCGGWGPVHKARIFMHELGHNLGLQHGGHERENLKPNYGSIMNYRYLSVGADGNCDARPDSGLLAYSDEVRRSIDETAIDEVKGMCEGIPADIDLDQTIDQAVYSYDVNGGGLSTLHGSDDFATMDVGAFADRGPNPQTRTWIDCPDPW